MYIGGWGELPLVGAAGAFENGSSLFSGIVGSVTSFLQDIGKVPRDDSNVVTWLNS